MNTSLAQQEPEVEDGRWLRVVACPHPFSMQRRELRVEAGLTLREILDRAGLPTDRQARVFVDDWYIPREWWPRTRPKAGRIITIRAIPAGSREGNKDALRIVAMVGILALAIFFPPLLGLTGLAAGLLGAGIGIGGGLLVNALIPPPKPKLAALSGTTGETSPALSITGSSNQISLYGPVPRVYGRHRIYPPLGARPFTEIVGNDQYLRMLFIVGYGPLQLSDFRIGETPLAQFADVEVEVRHGYTTDPPVTLIPHDVYEDTLSIALTPGTQQIRLSQPATTEISIDVTFPNGLVAFWQEAPLPRTVQINVDYRRIGTTEWMAAVNIDPRAAVLVTSLFGINNDLRYEARVAGSAGNNIAIMYSDSRTISPGVYVFGTLISLVITSGIFMTASEVLALMQSSPEAMQLVSVSLAPGNDGSGWINRLAATYLTGGTDVFGPLIVTDAKPTLLRFGMRWAVAIQGQYEVRVERITPDTNDPNIRDQVVWTALRSYNHFKGPVNLPGLCVVAMRVKATDQLNGVVDDFSVVAESILLDWTGDTWIERPTSNPASIFRNIFQGTATAMPVTDDRMDLPALQDWHERNTAQGRAFNAVIDFRTTAYELARDVASVGRASFTLRDGLYSIIEDLPQTVPIQHFTPRNSWGFIGTKAFAEYPHAFKARHINEAIGWQQDERLIYADGYNADGTDGMAMATRFETLDLMGVTNGEQAWRAGRYHLAVALLRPEVFELNADIENLVCTRGDLVRVTHDIPLWGLGCGRVLSVLLNEGGFTTTMTLDEPLVMEEDKSYSVRIRKASGASAVQEVVTVPGQQSAVTFAAPIPALSSPDVGDLVLFGELNRESVELIVRSIEPGPDLVAKLTLVNAAPGVHTADTGIIPPYDSEITRPPLLHQVIPAPIVSQVRSDESVMLRLSDGSFQPRILVSFHFASGVRRIPRFVQAQFRRTDSESSWEQLYSAVSSLTPDVSIMPVSEGVVYDIMIRSVTELGAVSVWVHIHGHLVLGKTAPPPDVTLLLMTGGELFWIYPDPPLDFAGFRVRMHAGDRRSWSDAMPLHDGLITVTQYRPFPESGTRTFLVKAVDTSGNESRNPAVLVADLGDLLTTNVVELEDVKAAGFPGTLTGGTRTGGNLQATTSTLMWSQDQILLWSNDAALLWAGAYDTMVYETSFTPAAGMPIGTSMKLDLTIVADGASIEYRPGLSIPLWTTDSALLWHDDAAPLWTVIPYIPWPGEVRPVFSQMYEFRITTLHGTTQGVISAFEILLDAPDVVEILNDVSVNSAGTTRLPITKTYQAIKVVNLTLQNDGGTAVKVEVWDKNPTTGPLVKAKDAAGALTSALVDATVQGY